MKKLFACLLALALALGLCAQAEVIIIGGTPAATEAVIGEPIAHSDELEIEILAFSHASPANDYIHQAITVTLTLQNWSFETIDAAELVSFEAGWGNLTYPGVCLSGESVPVEMLMKQPVSFCAVVPNALVYGEEAEQARFVLTVDGTMYEFSADQFTRTGDSIVATSSDGHEPCFALVKADGTLWTWGSNGSGQLGDGTTASRSTPAQIMTDTVSVIAGDHMAAVRADGTLWTWGSNSSGQLGDGTTASRSTPAQILENVASVSLGPGRTAAILTDGTLLTWGNNYDGCLGVGSGSNTAVPTPALDSVVDASFSDGSHLLAIRSDGTLWGCGYNADGRLGDGTRSSHGDLRQAQTGVTDCASGLKHSAIVCADGNAYITDGRGNYSLLLENAVRVGAGVQYTLVLDANGTLWGCGSNTHGQLGVGAASSTPVVVLENVMAFDAGSYGAIAVRTDGSVWTWGWNAAGSYEDGTLQDSPLPVDAGLNYYY